MSRSALRSVPESHLVGFHRPQWRWRCCRCRWVGASVLLAHRCSRPSSSGVCWSAVRVRRSPSCVSPVRVVAPRCCRTAPRTWCGTRDSWRSRWRSWSDSWAGWRGCTPATWRRCCRARKCAAETCTALWWGSASRLEGARRPGTRRRRSPTSASCCFLPPSVEFDFDDDECTTRQHPGLRRRWRSGGRSSLTAAGGACAAGRAASCRREARHLKPRKEWSSSIRHRSTGSTSADEKDSQDDEDEARNKMNEHDAEPINGVEVRLNTTQRDSMKKNTISAQPAMSTACMGAYHFAAFDSARVNPIKLARSTLAGRPAQSTASAFKRPKQYARKAYCYVKLASCGRNHRRYSFCLPIRRVG